MFQYTVTAALLGSYVSRRTAFLPCFVNKIVFVVSKEEEVFQYTVTAALLGSYVARRTTFLPSTSSQGAVRDQQSDEELGLHTRLSQFWNMGDAKICSYTFEALTQFRNFSTKLQN